MLKPFSNLNFVVEALLPFNFSLDAVSLENLIRNVLLPDLIYIFKAISYQNFISSLFSFILFLGRSRENSGATFYFNLIMNTPFPFNWGRNFPLTLEKPPLLRILSAFDAQ